MTPSEQARADALADAETLYRGLRLGKLSRSQWPACMLGHLKLRGIFVGGCVARGIRSSFRAKAHAHWAGDFQGWVCVRRAERLADRDLMLHELAHVLTEQGHTPEWRARLLELGGTLDATSSMKSYAPAGARRVSIPVSDDPIDPSELTFHNGED